jgi:hypothetical protein
MSIEQDPILTYSHYFVTELEEKYCLWVNLMKDLKLFVPSKDTNIWISNKYINKTFPDYVLKNAQLNMSEMYVFCFR